MRFVFALIILAALMACPVMAQDLTSDKGKLSYAVGWDIGEDIKRRGAEFDVDTIIAAVRDSAAGNDPQVPADEMVAMLTELQQRVRQEQAEAFQKLAEENQAASEAFMAANVSKNGIVALPSGIQYRIIEEGDDRLNCIIEALRANHPVVFGTDINKDFVRLRDEGPVGPPSGVVVGGHAMLIVGYLTGLGFIVKNSWGSDWGDGGFCIMKPEYIAWPFTRDIWVPTKGMAFR